MKKVIFSLILIAGISFAAKAQSASPDGTVPVQKPKTAVEASKPSAPAGTSHSVNSTDTTAKKSTASEKQCASKKSCCKKEEKSASSCSKDKHEGAACCKKKATGDASKKE